MRNLFSVREIFHIELCQRSYQCGYTGEIKKVPEVFKILISMKDRFFLKISRKSYQWGYTGKSKNKEI